MKKKSLSIIIPTYNGDGSLIKLMNELYSAFDFNDFEIVIVNDSSPDFTDIRFEKNISNFKKYKYILLEYNVGEDKAVEIGLEYAEYDNILIIDDDFQHTPISCKELYNKFINSEVDVLYSMYEEKKHTFFRNLGSRIFNFLYFLQIKKNIKYISSFKILSKNILQQYLNFKNKKYISLDEFVLTRDFKIDSFVVQHNERLNNKSNYNPITLAAVFFSKIINRYDNLKKIFFFSFVFFIIFLTYKVLLIFINIYLFNIDYPKGYPTLVILMILILFISCCNFFSFKKKFSKISIKKFLKSKIY